MLYKTQAGYLTPEQWLRANKHAKRNNKYLVDYGAKITATKHILSHTDEHHRNNDVVVTFILEGFQPPHSPSITFHVRAQHDAGGVIGETEERFRASIDTYLKMREAVRTLNNAESMQLNERTPLPESLIASASDLTFTFKPWPRSLWANVTTQPLLVQIIGGAIATLLASLILAIVAKLFVA
ncbi:hypothetical protein AB0J35_60120 [Nonomuraea angiospora]|uniref:hypothetical protein n=1 Tax=Nonomuraea angiospora TaxID=46172 RepID=UPI003434E783